MLRALRGTLRRIFPVLPPRERGFSPRSLGIHRAYPWGQIDSLELDPVGILRLHAWSKLSAFGIDPPAVSLGTTPLAFRKAYRHERADVAGPADGCNQAGLILEYATGSMSGPITRVVIDGVSIEANLQLSPINPHYGELLNTTRVFGRPDIYGYGPPSAMVHPEVSRLLANVEGRVLDFGCGSGALMRELMARGHECFGVELDRPEIRASLRPDVEASITLTDGSFPLPFPDGHFDTVVAVEVVEHVPNYAAALAEMVRVSKNHLIMTVPDIEAIPLGFRHGFVPWHLLESTHVNFFTQSSLGALLAPHFRRVEFGRIDSTRLNDSNLFVSLVAVCAKH